MGDIIHALPAITALRAARPELEIGWLVEERWAELLCAQGSDRRAARSENKPLADWVHVSNFSSWRRAPFSDETWREIRSCYAEVRAMNYDVALDMQGAIRSALAARFSGAAMRIGSAQPREGPARMLYTRAIQPHGMHVVEQGLALASVLAGGALPYLGAQLPRDGMAENWAEAFLQPFQGKPLAILNPGAGWGAKRWPAESYGAVACALAKHGMAVLINHGPGEEGLAETVRSASGGAAHPLKCTVGELIAITRRAQLFLGGDTGPMHLAAALRVPVVALFGPTRPERNGPFATRSVVLRSPASRNNPSHIDRPDEGLLSIAPGEVIAAAEQLLGKTVG